MKKILLYFICFMPVFSLAQTNWLYSAGGGSNDEALDAIKSTNNKIYSTGYYSQTANFGAISINPYGAGDIFVSCQDASGNYVWVKKAGGTGGDRGTAITRTVSGNIIVTGFYSGSADFDGTVISSASGSQDIFVASYNESTGVLNWVQSFGGAGIEVPYDVCTDQLNNIIVTGQFKGTTAFGASTFTSMTNTSTGVQGYDIFVMKISPLGAVTWAKQGSARHDDRGMCLTTDNSNNIYLTGQFSDTLTFTNIYNNTGFSKSFLMKMGPSGNEIWFNRILGSYVNVYGLEASKVSNAIYLCGDFSGTLNYKNGTSNYLTSTFLKKVFVLKTDQSGAFSWAKSLGSENDISCRDLFVDASDNVFITGYFKCALTELSQIYGSGIFNSVGFKDVFVAKYNSLGANQWHNHFGGTGEDFAYSIFDDNTGAALLAGSFEDHINIPVVAGAYLTNTTNVPTMTLGANAGATVCGSSSYGEFLSSASNGHKDIFTTLPVNTSRPLYDYFWRTGPTCVYDTLVPFVIEDTVTSCTAATAHINLLTGQDNAIGPDYGFNWTNGSHLQNLSTGASGWYYVDFGYTDGCRSFRDSVYMNILADYGSPDIVNTGGLMHLAIPLTGCDNKLSMLNTDVVYLVVTNAPPGYPVIWYTPTDTVYNDSVLITVPGVYQATIQSPTAMCATNSCVQVDFWYMMSGGGSGNSSTEHPFEIHFVNPVHDATDTVIVCERGFFDVLFVDSTLYAMGLPTYLPMFVHWTWSGGFSEHYPDSYEYSYGTHTQTYQAFTSGNCTITCSILHPLSGAPILSVTRNFYLKVIENPLDYIVFTGDDYLCPGDTVQLHASGWNDLVWGISPGLISVEGDSLGYVNQIGNYDISASYTDTVYGCQFDTTMVHTIQTVPQPLITLVPSNGIICPLDSVHLLANPTGSNYVWYGPLGSINDTANNIYGSTPGNYYYSYIDENGCPLVSETAELNEYSTPSILVDPGLQICPGEEVSLEIDAVDGSVISWGAPFNDSALVHTVNTPGIYTCVISSCGITTNLSVTVVPTSVSAEILYAGPMVVCPTDTVVLSAQGSAVEFTWSEGTVAPVLETLGGGTFILTGTDESGCTSYDTLEITEAPSMPMPSSFDTIVCKGSAVNIHIDGADTIHWYIDPAMGAIHMGHDLNLPQVDSTMQFLVQSSDTACASGYALVNVIVNPSSMQPAIMGDSVLCSSESLLLSAPGIFGLNFSWTGPNGLSTNASTVSLISPGTEATGWYYLTVSDSSCTSTPDSIYVTAGYSPDITLTTTADTTICSGDTMVLSFEPALTSFVWSNGNSTDSVMYITSPGTWSVIGTDFSGCLDTSATIMVTVAPLPPSPVLEDTITCVGGNASFIYTGVVDWYNGLTYLGAQDGYYNTGPLTTPVTYTIVQVSEYGCLSPPSQVDVNVVTALAPPVVEPMEATLCEGDSITFTASSAYVGVNYVWTGPGWSSSTGSSFSLVNVTESHQGVFQVVYEIGGNCFSEPVFINVDVVSPVPFSLSNDTVLCNQHFLQLSYPDIPEQTYLWNGNIPNNITITLPGEYVLMAITPEGCMLTDTLKVSMEDCGQDDVNVFTPNGDGVNDYFTFDKFTMPIKEMQIYNRWGVLMRELAAPVTGWDGRDMQGDLVSEGVYYYIVIATDESYKEYPIKGFVHVFR